ncbi:MAG TPA: redoxin domain-containing protein [Mycobacteriales bacterium]|jgi:thiol-disulfide isomerase/thioredoxin|nr:redoxin domain-containing protein [Mycobacteriales bacterium]
MDLPEFDGATGWLNSPPLRAADLRGRVVLVDFCTYTCINWLRTLPYIRAWAAAYEEHGLTVVGVHTPEFEVEHDLGNVRRAVRDMHVAHPLAIDNDYAVWTAFDNHYWPARYVADAQGRIRHHHFGEGNYEQTETILQRLLADAGGDPGPEPVPVEPAGVEAGADWDSLWSPENYLGSDRTENFASPDGAVLGGRHGYAVPDRLRLNQWALAGDWTIRRQAVVLHAAEGRIAYRFHARDVHLVMGAADRPVRFRVRLDGRPPGDAHGLDVDGQGDGVAGAPRLYQLLRQPAPVVERTVEITFLDPGLQAYVFTFG